MDNNFSMYDSLEKVLALADGCFGLTSAVHTAIAGGDVNPDAVWGLYMMMEHLCKELQKVTEASYKTHKGEKAA